MNNRQDSRTTQANSANVFSASAGFPLDTSLDAELSPHNFANDLWDECPSGTAYTPFDSFTHSRQQSGSEITSKSTRFDQYTSAFNTHVRTPTVILQRPSIDNSDDKVLHIDPLKTQEITPTIATPIPNALSSATIADSTTATAGSSDTSSSLHDFGNLNLDTVSSGESGMVDYANHLFPLSPSGGNSTDMLSAPSSPVSEVIPPAKLEYIGDGNNYYSVPVSPTLLQTTYGGDESPLSSISSASSLPPPLFFNEQQQEQHSSWSTDVSQNPSPSPRAAAPINTSSLSTPLHTPILKSNHSDDTEQQQHSYHRSTHSAVEKKYRNNINGRITELKDAVPALRHARIKKDSAIYHDDNKHTPTTTSQHNNSKSSENDDIGEPIFMDGVAVATKLNKATILQKATEYVYYLRRVNNERKQDIDTLLHTVETQVPGGQDICNQYWHHVVQREAIQQQQSVSKGKKI